MGNRRIEMHEYRQIIYRLQQGQSARSIAKEGLASRTKISEIQEVAKHRGWLAPTAEPPDEQTLAKVFAHKLPQQQTSKVQPYTDLVEQWVKEGVKATVIYQHLKDEYQLAGSYNCVQRFVQKIKQSQLNELTVPLHFKPGEAVQVDFGQGPTLLDKRTGREEKTWFFVMTLCWSRHQYVELVTHQDVDTWLNCHQNAFQWFNGVVQKVIIDNPKCAITKASYHDPDVQRSYGEFAQSYGFIISACPPRDPKKKGRVESGVKYVKNNFVPLRNLKSVQDANEQLKQWVLETAGQRTHGSTFEKPLVRFSDTESSQLNALPATAPEIAHYQKVIVYKNCHVRHQKCNYSVPHKLYGETLWLKATATTVTLYQEHESVAIHPRQFKPGEYSTQQEHLPPNAQYFLARDADWCLAQGKRIGEHTGSVIQRLLTDPVKDLLRSAQSIIKLESQYGKQRLEAACSRALYFSAGNYKTIKMILAKGLDYHTIDMTDAFEKLGSVYQGKGVYQRSYDDVTH